MVRSLTGFLAIAALLYVLYLGMLYVQQRGMMFPGTGLGPPLREQPLPEDAVFVSIPASFGKVEGVFVSAPEPHPAPALLYFHGNAETVAQNVAPLRRVAELGVHVLLVEYPGYAGADGEPTRASLMEAARVSHDWLSEHGQVDPDRIVAMGRSIGSGPALDLSAERELAAIVLMAGFTSVGDMARRFGAPSFLIRDNFDNLDRIGRYGGPVLLLHGRADSIIPFKHGRRLAEAAQDAVLERLDCRHNDCPYFEREVLDRLQAFLIDEGILASADE